MSVWDDMYGGRQTSINNQENKIVEEIIFVGGNSIIVVSESSVCLYLGHNEEIKTTTQDGKNITILTKNVAAIVRQ
jgi:hypothetical protein